MAHAKLTDQDNSATWPAYLKKAKAKSLKLSKAEEPQIIRMDSQASEERLEVLAATHQIVQIIDNYDEQFAELQLSLNAHLYRANEKVQRNSIKENLKTHYGSKKSWQVGAWVYYPWNGNLVHVLDEPDFIKLRTIRNLDLITHQAQEKLYDFPVACVGMSVGSASALSLVLSGISRQLKLADGAVVSGSNLNRIMTSLSSVGLEKSLVVARMAYEMNPFIEVHRHGKLTADSVSQLFDRPWPIKAIIDEIDDLEMKTRLRLEAKKRRLPVLMATELGDSVMLDVERFDLEPNRPLFHDLVAEIEEIMNQKNMSYRDWQKHASTIIDIKNMPLDLQKSLLKIGSSIVTHPQLGSTVMITGGVTTFAIKQIALSKPLPSGRTLISFEKLLLPEHRKLGARLQRRRHTKVMRRAIDSM